MIYVALLVRKFELLGGFVNLFVYGCECVGKLHSEEGKEQEGRYRGLAKFLFVAENVC